MKKLKLFMFVALFGAMSFGAFTAYEYVTMNEEERFLLANVEALTLYEPGGGGETVKCHCKVNWFEANVCSASGSGAYCGGDPCSNHDGNCR